jgi:DNA (cytosine-5)-methyltransferase 1
LTLGAAEAANRFGRAIDVRFAVDFDDDAAAVYRENFSDCASEIEQNDIRRFIDGEIGTPPTPTEQSLRRRCGPLHAIFAGPPCQGHSDLNNSTRRDDPRNRLYIRAARAVEVLRPEVTVIENVPGVVHDKSDVVGETTRALENIGYSVTTAVIDLQNLGLPQRRRRHVLFASLSPDISISDILPVAPGEGRVSIGPFIAGLEDEPQQSKCLVCRPARLTPDNERRVEYLFRRKLYDLPDAMRPPCHRDKPHSYQSVYGRMRWEQPAQTITSGFGSPGQGRFIHPRKRRLITPHEAARIQGFPDFYRFSAATGLTALRTMIGNAVPPPLTIAILTALLKGRLI